MNVRPALICFACAALVGCQRTTVTGPKDGDPNQPGAKRLLLRCPEMLTIRVDGSSPLFVEIERQNFSAPVAIRLADLPAGVSVDGAADRVIAAGDVSTIVTLIAAAEAAAGDYPVQVNAHTVGMETNTQTVRLSVR